MKSMAIILTVVALAAPLAAHAANGKAAHASTISAQATGNAAQGCNCPPSDDPDPYVVHG